MIVVDDGSTDETPDLLKRYETGHLDALRVIRQSNQGESAARNAGILAASQQFVALLDSDNRWRPEKLDRQLMHLEDDPTLDLVFSGYTTFGDQTSEVVKLEQWKPTAEHALEQLLIGCCINTSTVTARRGVFVDAGLFDTELVCCQDHDAWLRIAAGGHRIGYVPEALTDYRLHSGNVSGDEALVAKSTERIFERLFANGGLPEWAQRRRRFYLSRCYLNSACRYFEAGQGGETRAALRKAFRVRPASVRPGWLRLYARGSGRVKANSPQP